MGKFFDALLLPHVFFYQFPNIRRYRHGTPIRFCLYMLAHIFIKPRKEWCEIYNIGLETVLYRINHKGMSVIQALTAPKATDGRPRKKEDHEDIG